jgi:RecB family exonuclease
MISLDQLNNFDTVRASAVPKLFACARSAVEQLVANNDSGSSKASVTGDLIHKLIELFHKEGRDSSTPELESLFSLADVEHAKQILSRYIARERLYPKGTVVAVEEYFEVSIPPHPLDASRKEIKVTGHVDQVRQLANGKRVVVDFKTGKPRGEDLPKYYNPQMAMYMYGIGADYGFYGRTLDLVGNPGESKLFYYDSELNVKTVAAMLNQLRFIIAGIRAGTVPFNSGAHCSYCPISQSFPNCGLEF